MTSERCKPEKRRVGRNTDTKTGSRGDSGQRLASARSAQNKQITNTSASERLSPLHPQLRVDALQRVCGSVCRAFGPWVIPAYRWVNGGGIPHPSRRGDRRNRRNLGGRHHMNNRRNRPREVKPRPLSLVTCRCELIDQFPVGVANLRGLGLPESSTLPPSLGLPVLLGRVAETKERRDDQRQKGKSSNHGHNLRSGLRFDNW